MIRGNHRSALSLLIATPSRLFLSTIRFVCAPSAYGLRIRGQKKRGNNRLASASVIIDNWKTVNGRETRVIAKGGFLWLKLDNKARSCVRNGNGSARVIAWSIIPSPSCWRILSIPPPSSPNRTIVSNNRITEATVYRPANISILSRCCEILMADSISNERSIEWI